MNPPNPVRVGRLEIGGDRPLALIAGPCVMEPGDMTMRIANRLVEICEDLSVPLVFKASFDKANRTSGSSFRGPGLVEGMKIFERVKAETGLPVTTDLHEIEPGAGDRRGCRSDPDSRVSGAPDRPARSGGGDGPAGQREEGAVHGPMGHEQRGRQADGVGRGGRAAHRAWNDFWLRPAGQRLSGDPADAGDGSSGRLRRAPTRSSFRAPAPGGRSHPANAR